jgi:hypothetical protein
MSQQAVFAGIIPNSANGIFPQTTEGAKTLQLRYTDKMVTTEIYSLKIFGPLSNFKI